MTKEQAKQIGDMVRATPPEAINSVMWAVTYHLALFFYGLATCEDVLEKIMLACNSNRDDNLYQRLGLDGLSQFTGKKIVETQLYDRVIQIAGE
jgi:hypothetical protein